MHLVSSAMALFGCEHMSTMRYNFNWTHASSAPHRRTAIIGGAKVNTQYNTQRPIEHDGDEESCNFCVCCNGFLRRRSSFITIIDVVSVADRKQINRTTNAYMPYAVDFSCRVVECVIGSRRRRRHHEAIKQLIVWRLVCRQLISLVSCAQLCLEFFPDSFRVCSHIQPKNDIIHCGYGYGVVVSLRQCISRNAHSPKNHVNHTVTASMQPITRRLSLCVCECNFLRIFFQFHASVWERHRRRQVLICNHFVANVRWPQWPSKRQMIRLAAVQSYRILLAMSKGTSHKIVRNWNVQRNRLVERVNKLWAIKSDNNFVDCALSNEHSVHQSFCTFIAVRPISETIDHISNAFDDFSFANFIFNIRRTVFFGVFCWFFLLLSLIR